MALLFVINESLNLNSFAGDMIPLRGRAWAGPNAVAKVLVSVDGGSNWHEATLGPRNLGKFAWIRWSYEWNNVKPGRYYLLSKAIDEKGNVQDQKDVFNYYAMGTTVPQSVPVLVVTKAEWRVSGKKLQNSPRHPKL